VQEQTEKSLEIFHVHSRCDKHVQRLIWILSRKVFEAGRDSMKAFKKWRLQGPRLERAAILGRKRTRDATPIWS
jgi:hypothetical protein